MLGAVPGWSVPAADAASAAAASCVQAAQTPYRQGIWIRWGTLVICDSGIRTSTAYGTLDRNGTVYDVMADTKAGNNGKLLFHMKSTLCPPLTTANYQGTVRATIVTKAGVVTLPSQASPVARITC